MPWDCWASGRYISRYDVDQPGSQAEVEGGEIYSMYLTYAHFGIKCSPWAAANTLNGGTRSQAFPDGSEHALPREVVANRQAAVVFHLCFLINSF